MNLKDNFAAWMRSRHLGEDSSVVLSMLGFAKDAMADAEWFVFSEPVPKELLVREVEAIRPAIKDGLVDLPYPKCAFALRVPDTNPRNRAACVLIAHKTSDSDPKWSVDFYLSTDCEVFLPIGRIDADFNSTWRIQKARVLDDPLAPSWDDLGNWALTLICGSLSMLLTPQVKQKRITYEPKQQKIRVSRGMPTTPITHVHTRAWTEAALETRRRESVPGTHASPRPHLRHGHVRKLQTGKRIWINPMIVGAKDPHGIVKRDHYRVTNVVQIAQASFAAAGDAKS